MSAPLSRRLLAEFLGSAFLAALVIGSGIAAQQLTPDDTGLQLLYNSAATAAGLFAIILMFGPVSGGHFNPVVSLVDAHFGGLSRRDALAYIPAQLAGCITGAVVANAMFALSPISISTHHRASPAHLFAEVIATLGLLLVIFALARTGRASTAPAAVGAYIGAAYWFTSSTSFANPAISIGRMFSDTFAGIAPASMPTFVVAQLVGGAVAIAVIRTLYPDVGGAPAADVVFPHDDIVEPEPARSRYGKWRVDGRQVMRKLGPCREPGDARGLRAPRPRPGYATDGGDGRAVERRAPHLRGDRAALPPSPRRGDAAQADDDPGLPDHARPPSRPVLRLEADRQARRRPTSRRTSASKRRAGLAVKTITNHLNFAHGVFAFALAPRMGRRRTPSR